MQIKGADKEEIVTLCRKIVRQILLFFGRMGLTEKARR